MVEELTLPAPLVVGSFGEKDFGKESANTLDGFDRTTAEVVVEVHRDPAPGPREPDGSAVHGHPQHLFQTQTLGADLNVGSVPVTPAHLVLHWYDTAV